MKTFVEKNDKYIVFMKSLSGMTYSVIVYSISELIVRAFISEFYKDDSIIAIHHCNTVAFVVKEEIGD